MHSIKIESLLDLLEHLECLLTGEAIKVQSIYLSTPITNRLSLAYIIVVVGPFIHDMFSI